VTCWSSDAQDFIITTFLRWDFKGDGCADSSKGNPVLPTACEAKWVRGALGIELKANTHPYTIVTPEGHRNSPANETSSKRTLKLISNSTSHGTPHPAPHSKHSV